MRAVVADLMGEPSEVLRLHDCPVPQPGAGQVRIPAVDLAEAPAHGAKPLLMFNV